jgi:hypothetical protein
MNIYLDRCSSWVRLEFGAEIKFLCGTGELTVILGFGRLAGCETTVGISAKGATLPVAVAGDERLLWGNCRQSNAQRGGSLDPSIVCKLAAAIGKSCAAEPSPNPDGL